MQIQFMLISSVSGQPTTHYLEDNKTSVIVLQKYPHVRDAFLRYNTMILSSAPVQTAEAASALAGKSIVISETDLPMRHWRHCC